MLQKTNPPTPFLDEGTKTNYAIRELQKIFQPRQRDSVKSSRENQVATRVQSTATRGAERLPTIQENKIGTEIMKKNYTEVQSYFIMMMRSSILFATKTEITKQ